MSLPIKILSTDFDGTLHTDFEDPPVPHGLQELIARLQARGVTWVINTGRDLTSLLQALKAAQIAVWPDYVVAVEREIHRRDGNSTYIGLPEWNQRCHRAHERVFKQLRKDVPGLTAWVRARFEATIYEDAFSPFCLIAKSNPDADQIQSYMDAYCRGVPHLSYVRNDIYARFSHADYNKGSALAEIGRLMRVAADGIVAAGDHLNDLPMLSRRYAKWLIAPGNAIPAVKEVVRQQQGYISLEPHGHGLADGLARIL